MMEDRELDASRFYFQILCGKIRVRRQAISRKAFSYFRQQSPHIAVIDAKYRQAVEGNFIDKVNKAIV